MTVRYAIAMFYLFTDIILMTEMIQFGHASMWLPLNSGRQLVAQVAITSCRS